MGFPVRTRGLLGPPKGTQLITVYTAIAGKGYFRRFGVLMRRPMFPGVLGLAGRSIKAVVRQPGHLPKRRSPACGTTRNTGLHFLCEQSLGRWWYLSEGTRYSTAFLCLSTKTT
jgi:hypothetical protein